jgi:hypothetical protein
MYIPGVGMAMKWLIKGFHFTLLHLALISVASFSKVSAYSVLLNKEQYLKVPPSFWILHVQILKLCVPRQRTERPPTQKALFGCVTCFFVLLVTMLMEKFVRPFELSISVSTCGSPISVLFSQWQWSVHFVQSSKQLWGFGYPVNLKLIWRCNVRLKCKGLSLRLRKVKFTSVVNPLGCVLKVAVPLLSSMNNLFSALETPLSVFGSSLSKLAKKITKMVGDFLTKCEQEGGYQDTDIWRFAANEGQRSIETIAVDIQSVALRLDALTLPCSTYIFIMDLLSAPVAAAGVNPSECPHSTGKSLDGNSAVYASTSLFPSLAVKVKQIDCSLNGIFQKNVSVVCSFLSFRYAVQGRYRYRCDPWVRGTGNLQCNTTHVGTSSVNTPRSVCNRQRCNCSSYTVCTACIACAVRSSGDDTSVIPRKVSQTSCSRGVSPVTVTSISILAQEVEKCMDSNEGEQGKTLVSETVAPSDSTKLIGWAKKMKEEEQQQQRQQQQKEYISYPRYDFKVVLESLHVA